LDQGVFTTGTARANGKLDEVADFQTGRYISSNEATWRIFVFPQSRTFSAPPVRRRTFGYSAVSVQDVLARPTVENTDRSLICLRRYNCGSLFNSCSDLFLRRGNGAANTIDKHEYL